VTYNVVLNDGLIPDFIIILITAEAGLCAGVKHISNGIVGSTLALKIPRLAVVCISVSVPGINTAV
jgi:hypothetical protein